MKSVGIDIGSSQIKVVEIQTSSKGPILSHYHVYNFSQKANADRELETIEFLRELASSYDPDSTKFILALSQDRVVIRNKTFPFSDRVKIARTLPLELEDDIPFTIENSVYDGKIIRTMGPQAEVLACATPKAHLEKLLELVRSCGFEVDIISTEGAAFANLFENWESPPLAAPLQDLASEEANKNLRSIRIVLNLGHRRTLVCAFENNHCVGIRSLLWGAKNIVDAIAKKYELPWNEAQRELETKGFILTTQQDSHYEAKIFSDTIARSVDEFVQELQLTLLDLKSELLGEVTQVDLTGGLSLMQGLGPHLTQGLEVPVNRVSILDSWTQVLFEKTDLTETRLPVALGLAIEGLKKPRNPALNFLKGPYAKSNKKFELLLDRWGLLLRVCAVTVGIFYIWVFLRTDFTVQALTQAEDALRDQAKTVARLPNKQQNQSGIQRYIREKKKVISEMKSLTSVSQMNSPLEIFKKISEATPPKKDITIDTRRIKIVDQQVVVEAYVNSAREADLLRSALSGLSPEGQIQKFKSNLSPAPGKMVVGLTWLADRGLSSKK